MEEAGEEVALFGRGPQPLVEPVLYFSVHDPVGAGDQELGRRGDRPRIGNDPRSSLAELEQDIDRDRSGDQQVGVIRGDAFRVVSEELRLDVAIDKEVAEQRVAKSQQGTREWHIELDPERG